MPMAMVMVLEMVAMPPPAGRCCGANSARTTAMVLPPPPLLPQDPSDPDSHCRRWDLPLPLFPHKCPLLCAFYAKFDIVVRPSVCFQSPRGSCTLMLMSGFKMCTAH